MQLSQAAVDAIDWAVVGIQGILFACGVAGAVYACYARQGLRATQEFNLLRASRLLSQVLAAGLALSQLLRPQVLWGPHSQVLAGGVDPTLLCRIFTALQFGLLEPAFLLMGLFSCIYSVQGRKFSSHPNANIAFFSIGFSLPTCAVQLVCALLTRILNLDYGEWVYHTFFSTYDTRETEYCMVPPPDGGPTAPLVVSGSCAFCTFALFSTLISAFFAMCYLLVGWHVTERMAASVISKVLVRRIRALQLLMVVLLPLGLACRGLTVIFQPFDLGFELLRLALVICEAATVLSITLLLVVKPVRDARLADEHLALYRHPADESPGWESLPAQGGDEGNDVDGGSDDDTTGPGIALHALSIGAPPPPQRQSTELLGKQQLQKQSGGSGRGSPQPPPPPTAAQGSSSGDSSGGRGRGGEEDVQDLVARSGRSGRMLSGVQLSTTTRGGQRRAEHALLEPLQSG